jgi:hypothetical protein
LGVSDRPGNFAPDTKGSNPADRLPTTLAHRPFFPDPPLPPNSPEAHFQRGTQRAGSFDGLRSWPISEEKAILSTSPQELEAKCPNGGENQTPEVVLDFVRKTNGFVLRLGASCPCETIAKLVIVEQSMSPHADAIANASELPFDDDAFDAITVEALGV